MVTVEELVPGAQFVIANQGISISYQWAIVEVLGVHAEDVRYQHRWIGESREPIGKPRMTPLDRFLEIVNAPVRGPHHTPRPILR